MTKATTAETTYIIRFEGGGRESITASSVGDACEQALEMLRDRFVAEDRTIWADAIVCDADGTELCEMTVSIDPPEPKCTARAHKWESPHRVVGGDRQNPGVFGHGGGVIIREVCAHCGRYRTTDTWAQRPDTGEQGLESVRYEDADEVSLAWIAEHIDLGAGASGDMRSAFVAELPEAAARDGCCVSTMSGGPCVCPTPTEQEGD